LDAGVAALRRTQANLKRYRAAVLKAACEGRLVPTNIAKWTRPPLGEITSIRYGKNLPTKQLSETGFPVFGANGIIGCHTQFLYEQEQVLISCRGAYSGKINISPPKCFVTNNSLVLEIRPGATVEKRFLYHVLQAVDRTKMVTGSAQPQVTINNAEVVAIPLPPLSEQTQIVAEVERRLSVVDELESVVKANLQRATRLRQSILHQAFSERD
jgi:type I restriction enzyme, S subunit